MRPSRSSFQTTSASPFRSARRQLSSPRPVVANAGGEGRGRGWPRRRCPRPGGRRAAGPATGSHRSSRRGRGRSACVANDRLRHMRAPTPRGQPWSSAPEGVPASLSPAPFVSGCSTRTSSPPVRSPTPEFTPSNRARPANATTRPPWPIGLNPLPRLPWSRRRRDGAPEPCPPSKTDGGGPLTAAASAGPSHVRATPPCRRPAPTGCGCASPRSGGDHLRHAHPASPGWRTSSSARFASASTATCSSTSS